LEDVPFVDEISQNHHPLVNRRKNDGKPPFSMAKSTINHHDSEFYIILP
jgi:hypothetical protein